MVYEALAGRLHYLAEESKRVFPVGNGLYSLVRPLSECDILIYSKTGKLGRETLGREVDWTRLGKHPALKAPTGHCRMGKSCHWRQTNLGSNLLYFFIESSLRVEALEPQFFDPNPVFTASSVTRFTLLILLYSHHRMETIIAPST